VNKLLIIKFEKDTESLNPRKRIKILIELSKFVIPTSKAIDKIDNENNIKKFEVHIIGN
jgi:hypothetical protein